MLLAVLIFLATLTLVIWQPRGLGIGWSALGGAGLALATGVVQLGDVPTVWGIVWNATLTFVAVIIISLVLDEAGTFEWAALHVARWGRGNGTMLFNLIVVLGAAIASVFANDGAALILTPIVFQMLLALKFRPPAAFAFVIATGFIADTTSLPLVVSNLVNIVSADFFGLTFARYALVMIPVSLVSLGASLLVLRLYFRKSIPARYDVSHLATPASAIHDTLTFRAGWVVLAVLLLGYFAADPLGVPIAAVAGVCATAIVAVAARRPALVFAGRTTATGLAPSRLGKAVAASASASSSASSEEPAVEHAGTRVAVQDRPDGSGSAAGAPGPGDGPATGARGPIAVGPVLRSAPWQVVLFSLGMYLVVYGLGNQGLTDRLGGVFASFADHGSLAAAGGTGFLVAGMSSLMNNMPTVLVAALGIDAAGASGITHELMVYANVIGADLGPKITPIGSLATLLWLHVLDRKGMHISWGTYFRIGITLTIPVLAITLLGLVAWLTLIGA
ncbi:arsenic transporter [Pengzhenrongella frigida]|uniref:Arsenic transporter n=2 Tax=Pengzhenrongella frigida TaxID=1259133 RepID=A0A4Q5MVZ0_9MICO|nr:arsenic transporter [Cellulomonas sp. HLT2-17]